MKNLYEMLGKRADTFEFKVMFVVICFILLFLRRPMEFLAPYVWAEDGSWNIPHYLEYGFYSIFQPVQGYLILPSKIISAISLKMSFLYYPEISMYLSTIFSIFCLYLIAYAPTLLRYKLFCAFAVIFIPSNPEVFILPLYSFWWGTLLVFLALLWNVDSRSNVLRIFCIVLGALSSPIVILCAPLFALRFAFYRHRIELLSLVLVIIFSLVQGYFVFTKANMTEIGVVDILRDLIPILSKFIGHYFYRKIDSPADVILMLFVVTFLSWCWIVKRKELGFPFFLLVCLYAIAILAAVKRVPISDIHPYTAGPRYFFYPYILFSWILIWFYSVWMLHKRVKLIFLMLFVCVFLNSTSKFYRLSESPDWHSELEHCINNESYHIPINLDGQMHNLWHLKLDRDQCDELVKASLFDDPDVLKLYPLTFVDFRFQAFEPEAIESLSRIDIDIGTWKLNTQPSEVINSYKQRMLSSWVGGDSFTGNQKLTLQPTETDVYIAYQTGPISKNQKIMVEEVESKETLLSTYLMKSDSLAVLNFKVAPNKQYEITLMDQGDNWGEWSAVYVPE